MDDQAMNDGASKNLNVCGECGEPQIFNGLFMVCDNIQCSAAAAGVARRQPHRTCFPFVMPAPVS